MIKKISDFFTKHEWLVLAFFVVLFLLIRLPGIHMPLHQDEYKWPMIVNPTYVSEIGIPHPPLGAAIYRTAGRIVGFDVDFRFVPLLFGTMNLLLLYYLMRFVFGRREAIVASLIWILSYFSVLASLMVDTDGEVMPFFFLLALISYFKLKSTVGNKKIIWAIFLVVAAICGFLVKVSFLLAIGAIVADFLWSQKNKITKKDLLKYGGYILGLIVGFVLLLFVVKYIFPFFNLKESVKYWEHFAVGDRAWFQTAIQCIKAVLYASPFLVLVPLFGKKEDFSKTKVFIFFLIFAFFFYIILFDFSLGALDRYLQLVILPLTIFSSVVLVSVFREKNNRTKEFLLLGIVASLFLVLLMSISHYVPPLHPKADWIGRVLSLRWDFVYPFSGGSGPLGFYVSFLFMALAWIISVGTLVFAKFKPQYKKLAIAFLIPIGLVYNGIFIEEYLFGFWNGHAPTLVTHAVEFIKDDPDIKMVTVYNDNGGKEIQDIGKYRKRLYVDPKFDVDQKIATLNKYKEHYFVLDVPRIDPTSVYQKYFDSCGVIYRENDKKMSATVYDCREAPELKK